MDTQNVLYSHKGILLNHKKEYAGIRMKFEIFTLGKAGHSQICTYCMSPFIGNVQNRQVSSF